MINNKGNIGPNSWSFNENHRGNIPHTGRSWKQRIQSIYMRVIWQIVEAIIIPILTYTCKTENCAKKKITNHLQWCDQIYPIPKSTPTTITLSETGHLTVEYIILNKQQLYITKPELRFWRRMTGEIADEFYAKEIMPITKKNALKALTRKGILAKITENVENVKHWRERRRDARVAIRAKYTPHQK